MYARLDAPAAARPASSARVVPLGLVDVAGLVSVLLALLVLAILQSRHTIFWSDELIGNEVLRAPTFARLLQLWRGGVDSSGFWFFALGRPWIRLFGFSVLSLRLFSATGVLVAALFAWLIARRFYPVRIVAIAVALPFLLLQVLRWQLANARCYGLMFGAAALVLWLVFRGEDQARWHPGTLHLLLTFAAYDLLAGSHILGVPFAGAFLLLQGLLDLHSRRRRPALYLSAALGILVMLAVSLPNLHGTTAVGAAGFWTKRPPFTALLFLSETDNSLVRPATLLLLALVLLGLHRRPQRDAVYLTLLVLFLAHLVILALSWVTTSIYVDRYMLPLVLGLVLLLAELLAQLTEQTAGRPWIATAVFAVLLVDLLPQIQRPHQIFVVPVEKYIAPLLQDMPTGEPVLDTEPGSFLQLGYYGGDRLPGTFVFPTDPALSNDPSNPGGSSGYRELDNFVRFDLLPGHLVPTATVLPTLSRFLLLTPDGSAPWMRKYLVGNPAFTVQDLGSRGYAYEPLHLWQVTRTSATHLAEPSSAGVPVPSPGKALPLGNLY